MKEKKGYKTNEKLESLTLKAAIAILRLNNQHLQHVKE